MKKLLLAIAACGVLTSACGRQQEPVPAAPSGVAETSAAAAPASPARATAATASTPAAAPVSSDGETIDEASVQVSPVAAAVAASTPTPQVRVAGDWIEGQHYKALPSPQPTSVPAGMVEVTEIFWYGCGHCYHLAPSLAAWNTKGRPAYVRLNYLPVVWNAVTREDARVFYTLEALGKVEALQAAVFRELHVNNNPLTVVSGNEVDRVATEKKVREFMLKNGISADDFGRTYRSFAVENKLRQAEILARRYMADHTPMFIVNGRWVTDVTLAGGTPEQLLRLLGDLAASERGR
jgi:thiol:disulfide interchange protein DsbA